jgi:predicted hydrocarbon binding protein
MATAGTMKVKAQGLLNAAKFIEEHFGREALQEVLGACSPAVRETYTSTTVINWHPAEELCELVEVAESKLSIAHRKLIEEIGAAGARANMQGMVLRLAFYWGKPEFLIKRAASMWRQFNDEGEMELLMFDDRRARVEVRGIKQPRESFCRLLTGWCTEVSTALGAQNATVQHVRCRARGDANCFWEVRHVYEAQ